ncbi:MAG TPA: sodium-dependent transporter [Spirochaetota bacterium]|mgnify:CR=1 FL=1|nr:sodium-dependent transporter [Spirochaetota bacterium]
MARERWSNRGAFIMAAIGSAIGLGNVWRFPYLVGTSGGGAFFIPYVIALVTTGIPLVALEYYLGIRYQHGPSEAYGFVKKRTNFIGWFALGIAAMITVYYSVVISYALNYIVGSIGVKWAGREKDYFFTDILNISGGHFDFGEQVLPLVIGNAIVWIAIFLIIFKGVKVVGKIVTWTVGIPWVLLAVLIVRGVMLEGAFTGLDFYLSPDFSKLADPQVWLAAYGQIFFSLSLGFGLMIAYASYMPKDSDINTNAWVVSFANCATSFFSGFAIFSTIGYLAAVSGVNVSDVAASGPGLAFVVYSTAIAQLPGGIILQSVFGVLFFIILFTLGIDSAFSLVEGVVTGLKDTFKIDRVKATAAVCVFGFSAGLLITSRAGLYWLDSVDRWMNWGLAIVGLMEAVLIGWFFNVKKASEDIDSTSSIKFGSFWIICVKYITPVILLLIIGTNFYSEFNGIYEGYSKSAIMISGWGLLTFLMFIALVLQDRSSLKNPVVIIGYLVSFAGFLFAFYSFYGPEIQTRFIAAAVMVVSLAIVVFCFKMAGKNQ